jgi:hypothetical protein
MLFATRGTDLFRHMPCAENRIPKPCISDLIQKPNQEGPTANVGNPLRAVSHNRKQAGSTSAAEHKGRRVCPGVGER